jgi:hypothetical protein
MWICKRRQGKRILPMILMTLAAGFIDSAIGQLRASWETTRLFHQKAR